MFVNTLVVGIGLRRHNGINPSCSLTPEKINKRFGKIKSMQQIWYSYWNYKTWFLWSEVGRDGGSWGGGSLISMTKCTQGLTAKKLYHSLFLLSQMVKSSLTKLLAYGMSCKTSGYGIYGVEGFEKNIILYEGGSKYRTGKTPKTYIQIYNHCK